MPPNEKAGHDDYVTVAEVCYIVRELVVRCVVEDLVVPGRSEYLRVS